MKNETSEHWKSSPSHLSTKTVLILQQQPHTYKITPYYGRNRPSYISWKTDLLVLVCLFACSPVKSISEVGNAKPGGFFKTGFTVLTAFKTG